MPNQTGFGGGSGGSSKKIVKVKQPSPSPNSLTTFIQAFVNAVQTVVNTAAQQVIQSNPTVFPNQTINANNGNSSGRGTTSESVKGRVISNTNTISLDDFLNSPSWLGTQNAQQALIDKWELGRDYSQFTLLNRDVYTVTQQPRTNGNNSWNNSNNASPPWFPPPTSPFTIAWNSFQPFVWQEEETSSEIIFQGQWQAWQPAQAFTNVPWLTIVDVAPDAIQVPLLQFATEDFGFGTPLTFQPNLVEFASVNLGQTLDSEDPAVLVASAIYETHVQQLRQENEGVIVNSPLLQSTSQQNSSGNGGGATSNDALAVLIASLAALAPLAALALNAAVRLANNIDLDSSPLGRWIDNLRNGGFTLLDPVKWFLGGFSLDPNLNLNQNLADPSVTSEEPFREGYSLLEPGFGAGIVTSSDDERNYEPTEKHNQFSQGRRSPMEINEETAQRLLEEGILAPNGTHIYTYYEGKIYEFPSSNRPGLYHGGFAVPGVEVPIEVRRQMLAEGIITKSEYTRLMHQSKLTK